MNGQRHAAPMALVGAYLLLLGFLGGLLAERVRFDVRRQALVRELASTQARLHGRLMELERDRLVVADTAPRAR